MPKKSFNQNKIEKIQKPMGILTKIHFGSPLNVGENDPEEVIDLYLAALLRNGQIHEGYHLRNLALPFEAYVSIPRPNSLYIKFSSPWVAKTLELLKKVFGKTPTFELLEPPQQKRYRSWQSAQSLYLYTDMFEELSPVRSPDFTSPIPLYLLPISCDTRDYLSRWVEDYQNHDSLWIGCGELEIQAYKQLANLQSELCKHGREYCQEIEKATRIPTYFYLMRYFSYRKNEDKRLCPGCGKKWALRIPFGPSRRPFDFRCKKCRLVSCVGVEDNDRYAKIGEFHRAIK